jgi:hypothetical protein
MWVVKNCEDVGSQKSLKFTVTHTVSTFHWIYALNFRHSASCGIGTQKLPEKCSLGFVSEYIPKNCTNT